jgi:hypothetical protein
LKEDIFFISNTFLWGGNLNRNLLEVNSPYLPWLIFIKDIKQLFL